MAASLRVVFNSLSDEQLIDLVQKNFLPAFDCLSKTDQLSVWGAFKERYWLVISRGESSVNYLNGEFVKVNDPNEVSSLAEQLSHNFPLAELMICSLKNFDLETLDNLFSQIAKVMEKEKFYKYLFSRTSERADD
jgi:hypothetical protein